MNKDNDKCLNKRMLKKRVTIAFMGIDGTGKSTHAEKIRLWLNENGIRTIIIPFHKWLFAGFLKKIFGGYVDKGRVKNSLKPYSPKRNSTASLIKPVVSLIDNIGMYYLYKFLYRDYDVIIFDRFICATFIKGKALNYQVEWLRPLWGNIKTDFSLVFDAPMQKSLDAIKDRGNHIEFTAEQLLFEKKEYNDMAKEFNYPIFDTSKSTDNVQQEIKTYLNNVIFSPPLI